MLKILLDISKGLYIMESLRLQRAGPALRVFLLVDLPEIPLAVRLKAASLKAVVNLGLFCFRNPKKGGEPLTFSATGKEEEKMKDSKKNRSLLKTCAGILISFDRKTYEGILIDQAFAEFIYAKSGGDNFVKKFGKNDDPGSLENEDLFDDLHDFTSDVVALAFGFGFSTGQMIDLTDPVDINRVKKIQDTIRKEKLLPYLPREKKAA